MEASFSEIVSNMIAIDDEQIMLEKFVVSLTEQKEIRNIVINLRDGLNQEDQRYQIRYSNVNGIMVMKKIVSNNPVDSIGIQANIFLENIDVVKTKFERGTFRKTNNNLSGVVISLIGVPINEKPNFFRVY